ncbi:MAG: Cd(II)/Pb(II)-responsive transcriptional regulator [Lautropia sp.]
MKIGELAKAAATPVETIRYYERAGLLPPPPRSDGNYRVYGPEQAERLAFIRHCRSLDMTLDEIRVLLRFRDAPGDDCGEVNALIEDHIGHVSTRIRELKALERQLLRLRERCRDASAAADCGILAGLARDAADGNAAAPMPARPLGHVHGTHRTEPAQGAGPARPRR